MATRSAALPPMAQISIIGTWVETMLYGVNCVLYALCVFVLLRGGKPSRARRMLIAMSTILFLLCTAHVGASLRQLLEAFAYAPTNIPNYSTTYWQDNTKPMAVLKDYLYDTLILTQYCILIWRLYVVFICDWRVLALPIILLVGCTGSLYAISVMFAVPGATLHDALLSHLIEAAWVLDMTLNVSITVAIAVRLWWIRRKMAFLALTRSNQHISSICVFIESGAIFMINNILILVFYATQSPAALTLLDVVSQSAALTPFLIVVQVGLTGRYRIPHITNESSNTTVLSTLPDEVVLQASPFQKHDLGLSTFHVSPPESRL